MIGSMRCAIPLCKPKSSFTAALFILFSVFAYPFGAIASALPTGTQAITGKITDALGRPLADVNVELRSSLTRLIARATSDAQGKFRFRNITPGNYMLLARKRGFRLATLIVAEGAVGPITLAMESEQPLNVTITATLNQARNALSPETGSTVYRFTDKNIDVLPQGDNTPLNEVLVQA